MAQASRLATAFERTMARIRTPGGVRHGGEPAVEEWRKPPGLRMRLNEPWPGFAHLEVCATGGRPPIQKEGTPGPLDEPQIGPMLYSYSE